MKKILFSPVGSTDPIAGQHDGALLHIIRVYKPETVYLYFSSEMCQLEEKDHRYTYCFQQLAKKLDLNLDIHYIRKEDLIDVHIFDFFITEFKTILTKLPKEEAEILLNVSSGTPAMKSALQYLAVTSAYPMTAIQVSTPRKELNTREDVKGEYFVELQWELNLDNEEDFINRCTISAAQNMSLEIKKNLIRRHLESYEYVAASQVANSIKDKLAPEAVDLIKAGAARLKLDETTCKKLCRKAGYKLYPKSDDAERQIFEFLINMRIKIDKEEYADYLRAISPLFFTLMERLLHSSSDIDLSKYVYTTRSSNGMSSIKRWDASKTSQNPIFEDININQNVIVNTDHYSRLIDELPFDQKIKSLVKDIRRVETDIRNSVAHTITFVTDDIIKSFTGFNALTIWNKLKELTVLSGISVSSEELRTYDILNEKIISYFD